MAVQEVDLGKVVGSDGKSAYQSAVEAGYTGTEAEFYAALVTLQDAPFLPLSGGTVTGELESNTLRVRNLRIPTNHGRDIYSDLSGGTDLRVLFPGYSTMDYYGYLMFSPRDSGVNANNGMVKVYGIADPEHDNDAANKKYVDERITQAAATDPPIFVKVETIYEDGTQDETNVKCYPTVGQSSYSMNYSLINRRVDPNGYEEQGKIIYIRIYPPQNYAFSGMYSYSGLFIESFTGDGQYMGQIWGDGSIILFSRHAPTYNLNDNIGFRGGLITGSFTLEVE